MVNKEVTCSDAIDADKPNTLAQDKETINDENIEQVYTQGDSMYTVVKTEAASFCEDYQSVFEEEHNTEVTNDEDDDVNSSANVFEAETCIDDTVFVQTNRKEGSAFKADQIETESDEAKAKKVIKRITIKRNPRKRKRVKTDNLRGISPTDNLESNVNIKADGEENIHDSESNESCSKSSKATLKAETQLEVSLGKDKKRKQTETDIKLKPKKQKKVNITCEDCKTTFKHQGAYENHLSDKKCKMECEYCGKVYLHGKLQDYKMHLKYHRKEYNYKCQECGANFMARSRYLKHQQRHNRPYKCDQCSVSFHLESAFYTHQKTYHANEDGKYPCPECNKEHSSRQALANHLRYSHPFGGVRYLPCSICGMLCKEKNLKKHETIHKTKDFKCDQCSSAFKTLGDLNQHKRRHAKRYSELCKKCGRGCYGATELREHMRVHTGEKPYICSLCDYRCALRGNLKLHMKVHGKSQTVENVSPLDSYDIDN